MTGVQTCALPIWLSGGRARPLGAPNDIRGGPSGTALPQSKIPPRIGIITVLSLGLALLVVGCGGNAAQQQAYEKAAKAEQQITAENAPALVTEYKQVIALQPGSEWAKKAQTRIEALEARVKAEELHKSVFQEHGID